MMMDINSLRYLLNDERTEESHIELVSHYLNHSVFIPELKSLLMDVDPSFQAQKDNLNKQTHIRNFNAISAYLISIQRFCQYEKIHRWGIQNLHCACILKSIDGKDHQNTIIRVFDRFRLASHAFYYDRLKIPLTKYQQQYLWLWEQLPHQPISLSELVQYLISIEKQTTLTTFQRLLIVDIRRFYGYVFALKPKKGYTPPTGQDKHQGEYLDENEAILLFPNDIPQKQNKALFF